MVGEAWWRDWREPVFIGVSLQPRASWGTLRNATGVLKGEKRAREREREIGRLKKIWRLE